jgi:hypothetical protein
VDDFRRDQAFQGLPDLKGFNCRLHREVKQDTVKSWLEMVRFGRNLTIRYLKLTLGVTDAGFHLIGNAQRSIVR